MDIRLIELGRAARPDATHSGSLGDDGALQHADRSQVDERDGVTVLGADRQRLAATGYRSGEGNDSAGGSDDRCSRGIGDVDAAMLSCPVRIAPEGEPLKHRTVCRPRPGAGTGRPHERDRKNKKHQPAHSSTSVVV